MAKKQSKVKESFPEPCSHISIQIHDKYGKKTYRVDAALPSRWRSDETFWHR
jgi:hypothetical protein